MQTYVSQTQKTLSNHLGNIPQDEEVDNFEDINALKAWTKEALEKMRSAHEIIGEINTANLEEIEKLSKMTSTEILDHCETIDKVKHTGSILKHLQRFSEPVILLDHSLKLTPLR